MAAEYPFTTEAQITSIAGQLALDLRLDDSADAASDLADAIDQATWDVYGYLYPRYSDSLAAENGWVQWHAAWLAVRALCIRRLNDVPESVAKECDRRLKQLEKVQARVMEVPGLAKSRRPVAVTNYHVDLNRYNNQIRVDRNKSTGVAQDYRRRTDDTAPDGG
jgi:phage gp36-like protein